MKAPKYKAGDVVWHVGAKRVSAGWYTVKEPVLGIAGGEIFYRLDGVKDCIVREGNLLTEPEPDEEDLSVPQGSLAVLFGGAGK